ncbi:putative lipid II flippase FtsW [Paraconexibacter sp.]|uniref:putative lipid II flippase FtsW n=1 Tax=Paraconexibacter sp. TaxID=2949640 RepID=UPI003568FE8A
MPRAAATAKRTPPAHPLEYNLLMTATLCLLAAGAVMVFSASSARTLLEGQGDGTSYLVKYVGFGALGFLGLHLIVRTPLQRILAWTGPFLAFAFVCLLLVKTPLGVSVNGAQRWLGAGPLTFQPSEITKLALLLYSVKLLARRPRVPQHPRELMPLGLVVGAAVALIASQPDLGTALVISFTTAALLIAAGIPVRWLLIGAAVGAVLVFLYAMTAEYRRARLTSFLDPWDTAGTTGFQSVQGQIALGSGGLFGLGLGQSVQKIFYLPEAHTDFILAIIGEELGVAGITVVLFLYGLIGYAGLRVAKMAKGQYAKLLAAGITAMVLSQATLNVFTVLGLAPLTGVPLPFLSYGTTSLWTLLASMGLLLNIAAGGTAHIRVVREPSGRTRHQTRTDGRDEGRDRRRRDSGARGAGAGGRRRTAG